MKNKRGNVAVITLIIVIVAITASVITWIVATKSQAPVQQSVVTQPAVSMPVTQTQPAVPVIQQIAQAVIYKNDKFGFQVTLPENWKDKYKVIERSIDSTISADGAEISFLLPTSDKSWEDKNYPGYAEIYGVAVVKNADWDRNLNECKKNGTYGTLGCGIYLNTDSIVGKTSTHIVSWFHPQGQPDDFAQFNNGGIDYLRKNFQQAQPTQAAAQQSETVTSTQYFKISELGLKFPINPALASDIEYKIVKGDDSDSYAILSSKKLIGKEIVGCTTEVNLLKNTGKASDNKNFMSALPAKQFNGFFVTVGSPQDSCSDDKNVKDMEVKFVQSVLNALKNISQI